jgi:hypothetical protein
LAASRSAANIISTLGLCERFSQHVVFSVHFHKLADDLPEPLGVRGQTAEAVMHVATDVMPSATAASMSKFAGLQRYLGPTNGLAARSACRHFLYSSQPRRRCRLLSAPLAG